MDKIRVAIVDDNDKMVEMMDEYLGSDDEINVNKSCMVFNGSDILFEQKKYCNFNYSENGHLVYKRAWKNMHYHML